MPKRRGRRVAEVATICLPIQFSACRPRGKEHMQAHDDAGKADPAAPSDPFPVPRRTGNKVRPCDLD